GYNCVSYVARDKWGNSSQTQEQAKAAKQQKSAAAKAAAEAARGARGASAQARQGTGALAGPPGAAPSGSTAHLHEQREADAEAQAASLEAAAEEGVPFCEECEQARRELEEASESETAFLDFVLYSELGIDPLPRCRFSIEGHDLRID